MKHKKLLLHLLLAGLFLFVACKKEHSCEICNVTNNPPIVSSNHPPVANAGNDTTITLPVNTVNLDGSRSTDSDNNITNYQWTKIDGPSSFGISNANAAQTRVINLIEGTYQFELKVTDVGGLLDRDTIKVTVSPTAPPPTCQPNRTEIPVQANELSNMPVSIRWPIMLNAENKLVIVSSDLYYAPERTISIYNKTTMQWTTSAISENMVREGWSVVAAGNKLFFAGGMDYNNYYNNFTTTRIDVFDMTTNTWSVMNLSEARAFVNVVVAGNKIFFAGGMKSDRTFSNKVDVFDMATNTWSTTSFTGAPRAIDGSTVVNNKIFFCGGTTEFTDYTGFGEVLGKSVADIDTYDLTTGQWSLSYLDFASSGFGLISQNGILYLAGGVYIPYGYARDAVEIINAGTLQKTFSCISQPNTFSNKNVTSFNNHLIFYNGSIYIGDVKDRIELYNTQTGLWSIGLLPAGMFRDGFWTSIIADGNKLYMATNDKLYELNF